MAWRFPEAFAIFSHGNDAEAGGPRRDVCLLQIAFTISPYFSLTTQPLPLEHTRILREPLIYCRDTADYLTARSDSLDGSKLHPLHDRRYGRVRGLQFDMYQDASSTMSARRTKEPDYRLALHHGKMLLASGHRGQHHHLPGRDRLCAYPGLDHDGYHDHTRQEQVHGCW